MFLIFFNKKIMHIVEYNDPVRYAKSAANPYVYINVPLLYLLYNGNVKVNIANTKYTIRYIDLNTFLLLILFVEILITYVKNMHTHVNKYSKYNRLKIMFNSVNNCILREVKNDPNSKTIPKKLIIIKRE